MARRTFRWNPQLREMVEVVPDGDDGLHYVRGDMDYFVSPIDGTIVNGRRGFEEHCKRHNVVPTAELKGLGRPTSAVAEQRERTELRERLWEYTDKSMRGRKCRD